MDGQLGGDASRLEDEWVTARDALGCLVVALRDMPMPADVDRAGVSGYPYGAMMVGELARRVLVEQGVAGVPVMLAMLAVAIQQLAQGGAGQGGQG